MFGLVGRPSVKSYKSIDDHIKSIFGNIKKEDKLEILRYMLGLGIKCFPAFTTDMLTEFASLNIYKELSTEVPKKIVGHKSFNGYKENVQVGDCVVLSTQYKNNEQTEEVQSFNAGLSKNRLEPGKIGIISQMNGTICQVGNYYYMSTSLIPFAEKTEYETPAVFVESMILSNQYSKLESMFEFHTKITNDRELTLVATKGGGIRKRMKGGAIPFNLEYLFSIYLNGIVSLFTTFVPGFVPINDLLSQFIVDLNINGRDTAPGELWIAAQVGGGGQSCYEIGKKADFDARVYLVNATYANLIKYIIGDLPIGDSYEDPGIMGNGQLSKLSNYINLNKESYFNPQGYRFELDEYAFNAVFEKTQIRQHKPEGGKFPVKLISIDIVWRVGVFISVGGHAHEIGHFFHYSGIFDLVVKEGYPYNTKKDCIINPYGRNVMDQTDTRLYCPIFKMSCLTETILETLSDRLNVFNRIGTSKLVKDFERLEYICDKSLQYFQDNANPYISQLKIFFSDAKDKIFVNDGRDIFEKYYEIQTNEDELDKLPGYQDLLHQHANEKLDRFFVLVTLLKMQISVIDTAWHTKCVDNMTFDPRAEVFHNLPNRALYDESQVVVMKNDNAITIYMSYRYLKENKKRESYFDHVGELKEMLQGVHESSLMSTLEHSRSNSSQLSRTTSIPSAVKYSPAHIGTTIQRQHSINPSSVFGFNPPNYNSSASSSSSGQGHGSVFAFDPNPNSSSSSSSSSQGHGSVFAFDPYSSSGGPPDSSLHSMTRGKWGGNKKTRKYLKKTNLKKSRKQRKSKKRVSKSNRKTKRK
jgi:hypothetical protein